MTKLVNFNSMPLGAWFKYEDSDRVYAVLERYGLGKIALMGGNARTQEIFSAKETVDQVLMVVRIDDDMRINAGRYLKLRSCHWSDGTVCVTKPEGVRLGYRCYDGELLDDFIDKLAKCPQCGSFDYIQIDREGDMLAPEATYFVCNDCGHESDPE